MASDNKLTVIQTLPALDGGGVERGTLELAAELVNRGHRSIVISAGGRLLEELLDGGSEHYRMSIGKKTPLTLLHIPEVKRLMQDTGAKIIHARSRLPAWISYLAWKRLDPATRPRFITTVHGHYSVNRYSKIMTAGERVIAISDFIREYIADNYADIDLDKVTVIPRGVDSTHYPYGFQPDTNWLQHWQTEYPGLSNKVIITLPGRLTRRKGQIDFLRVLAGLPAKYSNVHGLIVGEAPPDKKNYYNELTVMASRLGLNDRVTFTGHRSDLREIMSISDIVMSLSNEPEAFGRTVLESLCIGVPVVAYAHGGTEEILQTIFPAGMAPKNNVTATIEMVSAFLEQMPVVPDNNPFTLRRMLCSTVELYESALTASVT